MKNIIILLALFLSTSVLTAQEKTQTKEKKKVAFIEVAFFSDGTRLVDGKNISDKALEKKLSELQKKKGEVHYYTDKKMSKKSVMKNLALFKLFGKYKLRVISYKDKNFSKIGS